MGYESKVIAGVALVLSADVVKNVLGVNDPENEDEQWAGPDDIVAVALYNALNPVDEEDDIEQELKVIRTGNTPKGDQGDGLGDHVAIFVPPLVDSEERGYGKWFSSVLMNKVPARSHVEAVRTRLASVVGEDAAKAAKVRLVVYHGGG